MGRIKPAWVYQRKATEAAARQQYFATRQPPASGTAIQSRGAATALNYRSLLNRPGGEPVIYQVTVSNDNLAIVSAADAGINYTLGANEIAQRLRGSGVKPSRAHWYRGSTAPVRERTAWGTSWAKTYDTQGGRSHYSVPFSRTATLFTPSDLQTAFNALFGVGGTRRAALGAANGYAYLELERFTMSQSS